VEDREDFSVRDDPNDIKRMTEQELQELRNDEEAKKQWQKKTVHKAHRIDKEHGVSFSSSFSSGSSGSQPPQQTSKRKQAQLQEQIKKQQDTSKLSFNMDEEE
jgi:hypothetical protein